MDYKYLDERQVMVSADKGRTWQYHSTYNTKEDAYEAVQRLCRDNPGKAFIRKSFRPAYKADGTLAGS